MSRTSGAVTLADVASTARVSLSTASKVLNNRPGISVSTREHVRRVAASLAYTPTTPGRAASAAGPGMIGVVMMTLDNRWASPIMRGVGDAFGMDSTSLLLSSADRSAVRLRYCLESLVSRRVDGVVVIADSTNAIPSVSPYAPGPVVYAYGPSQDPSDVSFVPDNMQAGRLMAEHLLAAERRKIAFINGDPTTYDAARDRATGIMSVLAEAGTELVGRGPMYGDFSELWGRRGMATLLESGAPVDAVVGGADGVARGVLDLLRAEGRRVPYEIAVAGFDNWDELAMNAWPPLTTIDMNLYELGRQAAAELASMIGGSRGEPGTRTLPVRLVARESTASFL